MSNQQDTTLCRPSASLNLHKSLFLSDLYSSRTPFLSTDPVFLTPNARKILECVLKYCRIAAVPPTNNESFLQLVQSVWLNEDLSQINVAPAIRSMADIANKEGKIRELIVEELGFQQGERRFRKKSAGKEEENAQFKGDGIGNITLKEFLIKLAKVYDIYSESGPLDSKHETPKLLGGKNNLENSPKL